MWLLLGASIVDYLPNNSQQPSSQGLNRSSNPEDHNLTEYTFPSSLNSRTANESTPSLQRSSPCRGSISRSLSRMPSSSASRRLTPGSSTSSSPRHPPVSLPPLSPRRASFFSRRDSADAGITLGLASVRTPSLSVSLGGRNSLSHSASPSDKSTPRHIGEGALDDSDTSSESDGDGQDDETAGANSSDEGATSKPHLSPGPGSSASIVSGFKTLATTPSPLSRVTGRQMWTDEEERRQENNEDDDTSSPSPQSTSDAETDSQGSSPRRLTTRSRSGSNSYSKAVNPPGIM